MTDWPVGIYPAQQTFYIRSVTITGISNLTGHMHTAERQGARWVTTLEFRLNEHNSARMDALLASLKGPAGALAVPDFRRTVIRHVTRSMNDYAAETGLTFFDDEFDFNDLTQDGGFLCIEESVPLALEEDILFGGVFDAFLFGPDDIFLLTEDSLELWGESVGIPFLSEDGGILLTIGEGQALQFGMEEGFGLEAENGDDLKVQVGGRFFEGAGEPTLVGAAWNWLSIDGLAPGLNGVLLAGEAIQTSPGRMHLILYDVPVDMNGYGHAFIAPKMREPAISQPLQTGGVKVLMRLIDDDAGQNDTRPPFIASYQLRFEEILP